MKNYPISLTGKVTNPYLALDTILAYYFTAVKNSGYITAPEVRSLTYDINTASSSLDKIKNNVESSVTYLLQEVFDSSKVTVYLTKNDLEQYELTLDVDVTDDGTTLSISKLINATDSKVTKVANIRNEGSR